MTDLSLEPRWATQSHVIGISVVVAAVARHEVLHSKSSEQGDQGRWKVGGVGLESDVGSELWLAG